MASIANVASATPASHQLATPNAPSSGVFPYVDSFARLQASLPYCATEALVHVGTAAYLGHPSSPTTDYLVAARMVPYAVAQLARHTQAGDPTRLAFYATLAVEGLHCLLEPRAAACGLGAFVVAQTLSRPLRGTLFESAAPWCVAAATVGARSVAYPLFLAAHRLITETQAAIESYNASLEATNHYFEGIDPQFSPQTCVAHTDALTAAASKLSKAIQAADQAKGVRALLSPTVRQAHDALDQQIHETARRWLDAKKNP